MCLRAARICALMRNCFLSANVNSWDNSCRSQGNTSALSTNMSSGLGLGLGLCGEQTTDRDHEAICEYTQYPLLQVQHFISL